MFLSHSLHWFPTLAVGALGISLALTVPITCQINFAPDASQSNGLRTIMQISNLAPKLSSSSLLQSGAASLAVPRALGDRKQVSIIRGRA